jgi:hypothetical protein
MTHTVAYIFRRKPGMSLEAFLTYYEKIHGPLMVRILENRGLVSYDHYPVRPHGLGDDYVQEGGPDYDAISIYTFASGQHAADAWPIPELKEDSMNFIDFDSMITLPIAHRRVFP